MTTHAGPHFVVLPFRHDHHDDVDGGCLFFAGLALKPCKPKCTGVNMTNGSNAVPVRPRFVSPFKFLWRAVLKPPLVRLNKALMRFSSLFGATFANPKKRYGVLLGIYSLIYAFQAIPGFRVLGIGLIVFGYLGVLAVNRAWSANEHARREIVKKICEGNPDESPDLRMFAWISASQLFILFPLAAYRLNDLCSLFSVPENASWWTWLCFSFDSFCKSMMDWSEIYGVHFSHVTPSTTWGRHLVMIKRLTYDYILIQGLFSIFRIHELTGDAISALKRDSDIAVRVGRRASTQLIRTLNDESPKMQSEAAEVLGKLKDPRAVEPLIDALEEKSFTVRIAASEAVGILGDSRAVDPLIELLKDKFPEVREAAAKALSKLKDSRAVDPLIELLDDPEVTESAAWALGSLGDQRAVEPLKSALLSHDHKEDTSNAIRTALDELQGDS